MNELSLYTQSNKALNNIYNCACGESTTLLELANTIIHYTNSSSKIEFKEERKGDVKHSLASINKAKKYLGYTPLNKFKSGIRETIEYYR